MNHISKEKVIFRKETRKLFSQLKNIRENLFFLHSFQVTKSNPTSLSFQFRLLNISWVTSIKSGTCTSRWRRHCLFIQGAQCMTGSRPTNWQSQNPGENYHKLFPGDLWTWRQGTGAGCGWLLSEGNAWGVLQVWKQGYRPRKKGGMDFEWDCLLRYLNTWFSLVLLERFGWCSLARGSTSLVVGLEITEPHLVSSSSLCLPLRMWVSAPATYRHPSPHAGPLFLCKLKPK